MNTEFAQSQISGEISCPTAYADTVDFGLCLINDFRHQNIVIKNTGNKTLKIGPNRPSFSIEYAGNPVHQYDHEEFNDNIPISRELLIPAGETKTIIITYDASKDTMTYDFGQKYAKLTIGLYDSELAQPTDISQFVAYKEFKLIARKVRNFFSGYETIYNFDSVYINPINPVNFSWKMSNASDIDLMIDTQMTKWLTPNVFPDEFIIEDKIPLLFPANSGPLEWDIKYYPKDLGEDKNIYSIGYHYKDSLIFTNIELRGVGIEQNLTIVNSNAPSYQNDTIDIGKVWVGQEKEFYIIIANDGNLNFLAESQVINEGFEGESLSTNFSLSTPFPEYIYFRPTTGDTVKIIFTPDRIGSFTGTYKIKSDIDKRKVRGYPSDKLFEVFYLKGIGIEPRLVAEYDTVKFGDIVSHPDCPSSRIFKLKLRNIGNATLSIKDYKIIPPFSVSFDDDSLLTLEPNEEKIVNIIFSASDLGDYSSILSIATNANPPYNKVLIYITASRVNPDNINISIPNDLRIKPGHILMLPIIVDKNFISKARSFTSELTYNRTLMKYSSYEKLSTAVENTDDNDIVIREINDGGKLSLSIQTPSDKTYFMEKDTLIRLYFESYIGDKASTPVAFIEPLFGDGVCDKILLPSESNGVFTIDSICGLEYKLLPSASTEFYIADVFPNPIVDNAKIQYQIKAEMNLEINLYNQLGLPVLNLHNGNHATGVFEINLECSQLESGIYYLQFRAGVLTIIKKIIITK